jgi:excisionase family DNA binding protein
MPAKTETTTAQPRLLDIKAAAHYLSSTVWKMRTLVWEKKLVHVRLGHKILFDRTDLDKFVDALKDVA